MSRIVGPHLGSLLVLFRLWRGTSAAERAELWSAWRDILPDRRGHTERVIGVDLVRHIVSSIVLIELASIEERPKAWAWHTGVPGPDSGARSTIDLQSSEGVPVGTTVEHVYAGATGLLVETLAVNDRHRREDGTWHYDFARGGDARPAEPDAQPGWRVPDALIHRVAMAPDWEGAFRVVVAAMPAAHDADAELGKLQAWEDRRRACLQMAAFCRDDLRSPSRAAAWAILGADPAGPGWRKRAGYENYTQILKGIADLIAAQPFLLADEGFRDAVGGWRFLEQAGSDGEQDLIVSARKYGAMGRNEASEMIAWAQRWKSQ